MASRSPKTSGTSARLAEAVSSVSSPNGRRDGGQEEPHFPCKLSSSLDLRHSTFSIFPRDVKVGGLTSLTATTTEAIHCGIEGGVLAEENRHKESDSSACFEFLDMADVESATIQSTANADDELTQTEVHIESANVQHTIQSGDAKSDLLGVGLIEYLDEHDGAVFILDIASRTRTTPIYCNPALRALRTLESKIAKGIRASTDARDPKTNAFLDWAASASRESLSLGRKYLGFQWSARTIRQRWRVVSGEVMDRDQEISLAEGRRQSEHAHTRIERSQTVAIERPRQHSKASLPSTSALESQLAAFRLHRDELIQTFPSANSRDQSMHAQENPRDLEIVGRFDFTRKSSSTVLSPHLQFVLDFDWSKTELGPMSEWSMNLRRMINLLMSDPRPAAMYWGKSRTMIYNEPYVLVTGNKHPFMMGKTFVEAWTEIANDFVKLFDKAEDTGASFVIDDARFYIERLGYLEETYYSLSIIPLNANNGEIAFYNPVFETTRQVIADRRMAFLLRLGQHIASSREPKEFWAQLLLVLESTNLDLPFAILYSVGDGSSNDTVSESSEQSQILKNWNLEGTIRVPDSCTAILSRLSTELETEEFLPHFQELVRADSPSILTKENGTLPDFIGNDLPVMDGTKCESAVFLPIRSTSDNVLGFLLLGISPRKRYDQDYRIFIELLSRQLATSMASAVLFEEEIRRGRMIAEQAAQDRLRLSRKLEIQTHDAMEIEHRFRRMADLAPVGMFYIKSDGTLAYANNDYYSMTGHPRDVAYPMSWYNVIADIDHPLMDEEWGKLLAGNLVSFEIRLRTPFVAEELVNGEKVEGNTWIIASAYPEKDAEGNVTAVLGTLTDISRQKWMQGFQTRKMLEAVELKRQQENFIDMTSHEMRNPLSAIIQCADWIASSLQEYGGEGKNLIIPREVADGYEDAAQTIYLCAQHQKRIIDDILTLSKLDSDLLLITPVEVQPHNVIKNALKMFDSELQKSDMELRVHIDPSYEELSVDWVKLDPSRLLQVLINLTTNAIKFTQSEAKRRIDIRIRASATIPESRTIEYLPRASSRKDMSLGSAWGEGGMVYLSVEVEDTGRGLSESERLILFQRFRQASPRTHVQYGGSGLGLFISRELTELQGGQIGVASEAGVGSTFAFYVRARRCSPPEGYVAKVKSLTQQPIDMTAHTKIISPAALTRIKDSSPSKRSSSNVAQLSHPKHVLIVEDNIVNQKVLSKQLRSSGCTVTVANHGQEALDILARSTFYVDHHNSLLRTGLQLDIVLMDLEMPVMDGLTAVRKIREWQTEGKLVRHVPVIAVTANARSEQIAVAKEAGMDSVVTKPFRIPELLPEMERQVSKIRGGGEERPQELERSMSAPV